MGLISTPQTAPTSSPFRVFDVTVDRGAIRLCSVSRDGSLFKASKKNTVGQTLFDPLPDDFREKYLEYLLLAC